MAKGRGEKWGGQDGGKGDHGLSDEFEVVVVDEDGKMEVLEFHPGFDCDRPGRGHDRDGRRWGGGGGVGGFRLDRLALTLAGGYRFLPLLRPGRSGGLGNGLLRRA